MESSNLPPEIWFRVLKVCDPITFCSLRETCSCIPRAESQVAQKKMEWRQFRKAKIDQKLENLLGSFGTPSGENLLDPDALAAVGVIDYNNPNAPTNVNNLLGSITKTILNSPQIMSMLSEMILGVEDGNCDFNITSLTDTVVNTMAPMRNDPQLADFNLPPEARQAAREFGGMMQPDIFLRMAAMEPPQPVEHRVPLPPPTVVPYFLPDAEEDE